MSSASDAPRILVFGGINMGLTTKTLRMPQPGETFRGERFYSSSGGKGATQAVAAARLGAQVKMVGRVGDDLFGPALVGALQSDGIDVSDIAVDAEHASGVGVIVLDDSGQNRVLATYGANLQCGDEQLAAIVEWADETGTGDRSDLPLEPSASTWAAVSVSSQECPGAARCPSGDECFAERARATAGASDLVVTNLHLYGIDLAAVPFLDSTAAISLSWARSEACSISRAIVSPFVVRTAVRILRSLSLCLRFTRPRCSSRAKTSATFVRSIPASRAIVT